ncbi:spidroin-2-like [Mustela putorius furo]|uniref:Spidroin-2-like n=1 Tax=Mustela putorius furo TaxID=9669 RepID=A0A8U0UU48_MUSPF|nr:spidroin-2-like [Mustela putorius furo]
MGVFLSPTGVSSSPRPSGGKGLRSSGERGCPRPRARLRSGVPPRVGFSYSPLSLSWPGQQGPGGRGCRLRSLATVASASSSPVPSGPLPSAREAPGAATSRAPASPGSVGARRRTDSVRARLGLGLGSAPLQAPAPPRPPRRAPRPSPSPARQAAAAAASPRGLRRSGRRRAAGRAAGVRGAGRDARPGAGGWRGVGVGRRRPATGPREQLAWARDGSPLPSVGTVPRSRRTPSAATAHAPSGVFSARPTRGVLSGTALMGFPLPGDGV